LAETVTSGGRPSGIAPAAGREHPAGPAPHACPESGSQVAPRSGSAPTVGAWARPSRPRPPPSAAHAPGWRVAKSWQSRPLSPRFWRVHEGRSGLSPVSPALGRRRGRPAGLRRRLLAPARGRFAHAGHRAPRGNIGGLAGGTPGDMGAVTRPPSDALRNVHAPERSLIYGACMHVRGTPPEIGGHYVGAPLLGICGVMAPGVYPPGARSISASRKSVCPLCE
jgi:hypothetical protein